MRCADDMLSDDLEEETEEEVVELSEADLLQFLDSQEPSLQVASPMATYVGTHGGWLLSCICAVNAGMLKTVHSNFSVKCTPAQACDS